MFSCKSYRCTCGAGSHISVAHLLFKSVDVYKQVLAGRSLFIQTPMTNDEFGVNAIKKKIQDNSFEELLFFCTYQPRPQILKPTWSFSYKDHSDFWSANSGSIYSCGTISLLFSDLPRIGVDVRNHISDVEFCQVLFALKRTSRVLYNFVKPFEQRLIFRGSPYTPSINLILFRDEWIWHRQCLRVSLPMLPVYEGSSLSTRTAYSSNNIYSIILSATKDYRWARPWSWTKNNKDRYMFVMSIAASYKLYWGMWPVVVLPITDPTLRCVRVLEPMDTAETIVIKDD